MLRSETSADKNAELLEKAEQYIPGGSLGTYFMPAEGQFVVARGQGSKVYDFSGREYIDWVMGSGPMVIGHAHPKVVEAVQRQCENGTQFYTLTEPAIRLAEKMVGAIPCAEQVKFSSSGSEATFYALRLARAHTGRSKILKFEGGYHGHQDYTLTRQSAGIPESVRETVLVAPFNDLETARRLIEENKNDLAAVIVEALQRITPPKPGFLEGLREATAKHGIVLVFDEVVTGFRLAWGGAQEFYGVTPDLATYGKTIGGGYPVSAVAGPRRIMQLSNPVDKAENYVYISGTLNGNPIGAAAGLATLEVLEQPGTYKHLFHIGDRLREGLRQVAKDNSQSVQTTGAGPLVGVVFTEGDTTDPYAVGASDRKRQEIVEAEMLKNGILINLAAKLYVSLAHTDDDVDRTLEVFGRALKKL
ncbi:MAG: aminotransferase class III-fold pyridoxal phosphate-dependent enzyme [Chloroflexi bacterium]|nr:aminotransferase class III-fold pyridoxal phosphate-dependent enzyme [Chloroflexota bacterium]